MLPFRLHLRNRSLTPTPSVLTNDSGSIGRRRLAAPATFIQNFFSSFRIRDKNVWLKKGRIRRPDKSQRLRVPKLSNVIFDNDRRKNLRYMMIAGWTRARLYRICLWVKESDGRERYELEHGCERSHRHGDVWGQGRSRNQVKEKDSKSARGLAGGRDTLRPCQERTLSKRKISSVKHKHEYPLASSLQK